MGRIIVLGVFMADTTYRAARMPRTGETVRGESFALGPGGKGSNQAVAAAKAGGDVHFISRIGTDVFGDMALSTWKSAGVRPAVQRMSDVATGAACILVDAESGDNAIIIAPGAALTILEVDIIENKALFDGASVFMTQLEQPFDAVMAGLELARDMGVTTILNPAPAAELDDNLLKLCDYITPNESEAEGLTGIKVNSVEDAAKAADALMARGVGAVLVTLGERGVLYKSQTEQRLIPANAAGPVVETTGAGDGFNGGFAVGLAEGLDPIGAAAFGCALAGISITRPGAAASMPTRAEIDALLETIS
ncbi:MAG: ribokinase [Deltaproteobacteria bacterium]